MRSSTWLRLGSPILPLGPERDCYSNHPECWWGSAKYSKEKWGKHVGRQHKCPWHTPWISFNPTALIILHLRVALRSVSIDYDLYCQLLAGQFPMGSLQATENQCIWRWTPRPRQIYVSSWFPALTISSLSTPVFHAINLGYSLTPDFLSHFIKIHHQ